MFACLFSPDPAAFDVLSRVAHDFSPRVEYPRRDVATEAYKVEGRLKPDPTGVLTASPAESIVLIDLDGLERLFGEPGEIAIELQQQVRLQPPLDCARGGPAHVEGPDPAGIGIALASTRAAAEILARHARHVTVVARGEESAALAHLPLALLAPLGAPAALLDTLARWGLKTMGEFVALPRARLSSRIGQDGLRWQRRARGEDDRPLIPTQPEERFEDVLDLEWPVNGIEPLAFILGRLLDPLCERLERRDRAVAVMELRLRIASTRTWQTRRLELPAPLRDARLLRTLLCLDLESRPPSDQEEHIDRVGLYLEPTPARVCQFSLLTRPTVSPEQVATLMARLRALVGEDRCGSPRLVDTHRPGAFAMDTFRAGEAGRAGGTGGTYVGPPSRKEHASAGLRALRRFRHPIPARVVVEHHRPVSVTTDRRRIAGGHVVWCSGPWRTSGDWWHTQRARDENPDRASESGTNRAKRAEGIPPALSPSAALPGHSTPLALTGHFTPPALPPWDSSEWDVTLSDGGTYILHEERPVSRWFVDAVID